MFVFNAPQNSLSFGQISHAILFQAWKDKIDTLVFPIGGNVDLSCQKVDQEYVKWLQEACINAQTKHTRNNIVTKLWHISNSLESFSKEQNLITFHECSELTKTEINILRNQKTVFVTSNYSKRIMEDYQLKNVKYLELGFDKENFYDLKKTYYTDGCIVHGLAGKLENRKAHGKILRAWGRKYGNNPKYRLHAALFNPFIKPEDQAAMINNELQGNRYGNIIFMPLMKTNAEYLDYICSINVMLALSRGEARDLPVFHAVGLGKHCVGLRAHAYLDYLNDENATLINPTGRIKAQDGIFFHGDNSQFNVGSFYDWDDGEFIDALEAANKKFRDNPINTKGLELQNKTYKQTLDTLLQHV